VKHTWSDLKSYAAKDAEETLAVWRAWERIVAQSRRRFSGGMPTPGKEHE
jgi:hypothetical protein